MKILFLSRLFDPHIGGVEKHVAEISKILIKKGNEVTVITEKYEKNLPDYEIKNGVKIIRIDSGSDNWFKKFRVWKKMLEKKDLIEKADVVHAHDVFFWYLPFKFIYPSKKTYVTLHGYEGNNIPGITARIMHKMAEKMTLGNICVGKFLEKWYGTKSDFIIYGGVSKIQNSKFKIQNYNSEIKILFLGRLEEETGIMIYLEALKALRTKGFNLKLNVLGDGSLRMDAEKFSKKNGLKVNFRGFVKSVETYIKSSDIIFVSRYLGILEALSFGKPVFAVYNNAIKKDYLTMTPFAKNIFISGNKNELYSQVESFLNKHQDLSDSWIKNQTWEKITDTYLKLWKKR